MYRRPTTTALGAGVPAALTDPNDVGNYMASVNPTLQLGIAANDPTALLAGLRSNDGTFEEVAALYVARNYPNGTEAFLVQLTPAEYQYIYGVTPPAGVATAPNSAGTITPGQGYAIAARDTGTPPANIDVLTIPTLAASDPVVDVSLLQNVPPLVSVVVPGNTIAPAPAGTPTGAPVTTGAPPVASGLAAVPMWVWIAAAAGLFLVLRKRRSPA